MAVRTAPGVRPAVAPRIAAKPAAAPAASHAPAGTPAVAAKGATTLAADAPAAASGVPGAAAAPGNGKEAPTDAGGAGTPAADAAAAPAGNGKEAPTDAGGAGTPAADAAAAPAAPAAPGADETAKRFAALSRREATTRQAENKAKVREAELASRETALKEREAKVGGFEDLGKLALADPHGFMEKIGVPGRQFLVALGSAPAADDPIAKVNKTLAEERAAREKIEKTLADEKKAATDREAAAKKEGASRAIEAKKAEIAALLGEKADDFELLLGFDEGGEKGHDLVWGIMDAQWDKANAEFTAAVKDGEDETVLQTIRDSAIIPLEVAAKHAEEFLEERYKAQLERLGRSKKFSGLTTPPAPAAPAPAAPGKQPAAKPTGIGRSPTLAGTEPTVSTKPPEPPKRFKNRRELEEDIENRRQAILARYEKK